MMNNEPTSQQGQETLTKNCEMVITGNGFKEKRRNPEVIRRRPTEDKHKFDKRNETSN